MIHHKHAKQRALYIVVATFLLIAGIGYVTTVSIPVSAQDGQPTATSDEHSAHHPETTATATQAPPAATSDEHSADHTPMPEATAADSTASMGGMDMMAMMQQMGDMMTMMRQMGDMMTMMSDMEMEMSDEMGSQMTQMWSMMNMMMSGEHMSGKMMAVSNACEMHSIKTNAK